MRVSKGAAGRGDSGEDLGYGETLPNDTGRHHERAAWRRRRVEAGVHSGAHADGIFKATLTGNGIGAARVDDDGVESLAAAFLEGLPADCDRGGLELVLGKDSSARAGFCRCDKGQVRETSIGRLHADIGSRYLETLWVGS